MMTKNTVSIDFGSTLLDSIGVFECRLHGVIQGFKVDDKTRDWRERGTL